MQFFVIIFVSADAFAVDTVRILVYNNLKVRKSSLI